MGHKQPKLAEKGRAMSLDRAWNQYQDFKADFATPADALLAKPEVSPQDEANGKASTWVPLLLTLLAGQGALLFGIHIGFSSPAEEAIQGAIGAIKDDTDVAFSLISVGAIFGCLSAAGFADFLGRKLATMGACLPFLIGTLLLIFFPSLYVLGVARLVIGIGVGLVSVLVPLYIAEISPSHLRGALGSANQFLIAFGIVIVNAVGLPILNDSNWWRGMLYLSLIPVAILFFGMMFIGVETPRWLVKKQKDEEAERVLSYIRGPEYNISAELNDIIQTSNKGTEEETSDGVKTQGGLSEKLRYLFTKGLRPFLIGITLQLLQQWTGINAIMFYTGDLFKNKPTDPLTARALYGAIGVNVVQVLMCGVTILCMNLAGRRTFLMTSHFGMSVVGIVLGFAYKLQWPQITTIALVMVYLAFFSIGVGPLPWLLCSEIFPSKTREISMSIATFVNWASAFGVTSTVSPFKKHVGIWGVFWFYSAVGLLGIVIVFLVLPETKDKTLDEIEAFFVGEDEVAE